MRLLLTTALVTTAAIAPAANAAAAPPVVKSVSPLKAQVGGSLKVGGSGFAAGANKNTVVFMSNYGPTIFVKVPRASATVLTVPLPSTIERGMRGYPKDPKANRFQIKVVSNSAGSSFTPAAKSPVISPGAKTPPPPPDPNRDDDGDFLNDALEKSVRTDPRKRDTDGDGREDGWEYYSAKDLNVKAVPYPGERPYPNPLEPTDANVDFDGDSLTSAEEHSLWTKGLVSDSDPDLPDDHPSRRSYFPNNATDGAENSVLGYSDGTQSSRPGRPSRNPNFVRQAGLYEDEWLDPNPIFADDETPDNAYDAYPGLLEGVRDGDQDQVWTDDERDGDNDGLNNYNETHGYMNPRLWNGVLAKCKPDVKKWNDAEGQYFGKFELVTYVEPDMLDADTDGDGLLDAEDDQDRDDVPNFSELYLACVDLLTFPESDPIGRPNVHPYNPCAPRGHRWFPAGDPGWSTFGNSRTCPRYKPVSSG